MYEVDDVARKDEPLVMINVEQQTDDSPIAEEDPSSDTTDSDSTGEWCIQDESVY